MKSDVQLHWDYFLLLEKDLMLIGETVELSENNYAVYGPRILQLILASGSELDVALKSFAKAVDTSSRAATKAQPNMGDYKDLLVSFAVFDGQGEVLAYRHCPYTLGPIGGRS